MDFKEKDKNQLCEQCKRQYFPFVEVYLPGSASTFSGVFVICINSCLTRSESAVSLLKTQILSSHSCKIFLRCISIMLEDCLDVSLLSINTTVIFFVFFSPNLSFNHLHLFSGELFIMEYQEEHAWTCMMASSPL